MTFRDQISLFFIKNIKIKAYQRNKVLKSFFQCSATCGGGLQTRKVSCRDSNHEEVESERCNGNHSALSQNCGFKPCPYWEMTEFSSVRIQRLLYLIATCFSPNCLASIFKLFSLYLYA